jgi:predicted metalloprotease
MMDRTLVRALLLSLLAITALIVHPALAGATDRTHEQKSRDSGDMESIERVVGEVDALFAELFATNEMAYVSPRFLVVSQTTQTGCGSAEAGAGSFYCPGDVTVYLDLQSLTETYEEHGTVPMMVAVAREFGHHVQAHA